LRCELPASSSAAVLPFPDYTECEREVLDLTPYGLNNQQNAVRFRTSSKTISNHILYIITMLQVVDRAQAIIKARQAGLVTAKVALTTQGDR
jgi:DNA-binding NarL/FixJ family response regulator